MRKRWLVFMVLVLSLSLFVLTTRAQETTAEPTAEATTATEAPAAEVTAEVTTALEAPTAEVSPEATATAEATAEATEVSEPLPPTATPAVENPDSAENAPTGLSTLVLLMGLGAVSIVGLAMVARENLRNKASDKS